MGKKGIEKRMREIRRKGKAGEEIGLLHIALKEGFAARIKRIREGGDFEVQRPNIYTGKVEKRRYEIKAGPKARLSKRQEKSKKKIGKNFVELRVDVPPFMYKDI